MPDRLRLFPVLILLALAACSEPVATPLLTGPATGPTETVFIATTRARDDDGSFTGGRAEGTSFLTLPVVFPADYRPGKTAVIRSAPRPDRDFSVGAETPLDRAGFRAALGQSLADMPAGQRDLTLYVHGFYNAFYNGAFRAAQLRHDFDLPGAMVHFAWPSRGVNTAYAYDRESVLYSRDALERVIRDLASVGAERVTIIGHSLGAMLVMETLRQIEISDPGWVHANVRGLAFVSPDIDVEVFKSQAARFRRLPEDFVIFVSDRDRVLMLASKVTGVKRRLGNTRNVEITTEGALTIVDVTALSEFGGSGHFVPATSPTAIRILRNSAAFLDFFPREGLSLPAGANVRLLQIAG